MSAAKASRRQSGQPIYRSGCATAALPNPRRRRYFGALAAGLTVLSGCGGGGGGSSGDGGGGGSSPTSLGPPATGSFGGGQGQLLYVEHQSYASVVRQMALASRQIQTVVQVSRGPLYGLVGGVTRAADGSFLVTDYAVSLDGTSNACLYRGDGTPIRTFALANMVVGGATLSPDGRSIAYVCPRVINDNGRIGTVIMVAIIDTATGQAVSANIVGLDDPREDKTLLASNSLTVWTPDSTPYAVVPGALYRVDRGTAVSTRIQAMPSNAPGSLAASRDGSQIWFQNVEGSPAGPALWSIDIATGAIAQRTVRAERGRQYSPSFSPDGQWLMLEQGRLEMNGALMEYFDVSAVRVLPTLVDTAGLALQVLDSVGRPFEAKGPVAWF